MKQWRIVNKVSQIRGWRIPVLIFSFLVSATMLLGSTMAWFTTSNTKNNSFTSTNMSFDLSVREVFVPEPAEPGMTIAKQVFVTNNGDMPAFVRLMVLPEILAAGGEMLLPAGVGNQPGGTADDPLWFDGLDGGANWLYGGDGYWYYLGKLEPGQSTPNLFTGVTMDDDLPEAYQNASMFIEIKLEAARAKQWDYREGWWGSITQPPPGALRDIDSLLVTQLS